MSPTVGSQRKTAQSASSKTPAKTPKTPRRVAKVQKRKAEEAWEDDETETLSARVKKGDDFKLIAKDLHRTIGSCKKKWNELRRHLKKDWTEEEDETLVRMWFERKDMDEMVDALPNKSRAQIKKRRIQHSTTGIGSRVNDSSDLYKRIAEEFKLMRDETGQLKKDAKGQYMTKGKSSG